VYDFFDNTLELEFKLDIRWLFTFKEALFYIASDFLGCVDVVLLIIEGDTAFDTVGAFEWIDFISMLFLRCSKSRSTFS
jgi:hypothetical protein